jgi:hypothetical protein
MTTITLYVDIMHGDECTGIPQCHFCHAIKSTISRAIRFTVPDLVPFSPRGARFPRVVPRASGTPYIPGMQAWNS